MWRSTLTNHSWPSYIPHHCHIIMPISNCPSKTESGHFHIPHAFLTIFTSSCQSASAHLKPNQGISMSLIHSSPLSHNQVSQQSPISNRIRAFPCPSCIPHHYHSIMPISNRPSKTESGHFHVLDFTQTCAAKSKRRELIYKDRVSRDKASN